MSEMVERVARAMLAARAGSSSGALSDPDALWLAYPREQAMAEARAAVAALREPTATMRWKGQDAIGNDLRFVSPQDIWQAMIDAALADG